MTAQVPIPALLRDREQMPSPRELQPHLSAAVNQAVSRGMAVEPQFRPTTVAEWLQLLPENRLAVTSPSLPTQAIPTINLSDLKSESSPKKPTFPPLSTPSKIANIGKRTGIPKGVISISIALVAATAGFSTMRILSKPNLQSAPKPSLEQTSSDSIPPKPVVEISPSSTTQKIQNSSFNQSVPLPRVRRKRQNIRVSAEPIPTSDSQEKISENHNSQPTPNPDNTTKKSTPVVTSSPSLMDTLRDSKESQKASPPPENTAPEPPPVVTPPQESQPENSSGVVVPTVETKQNPAPEIQQRKQEKPQS